jgi:putative transposase
MRKQPLVADHFYHIYNRGVNRSPIFFQTENWYFFLRRMRQYFISTRADLLAYSLMPNHFHLLIQVKCSDFGREVMQPLLVSYTKAINKRMNRAGPLFQGPFQARCLKEDGDLLNLSGYIHLNPVTAGLVATPEQWEFSSYKDYLGLRQGGIVSQSHILAHFPSRQAYADYISDQINYHLPNELLMD